MSLATTAATAPINANRRGILPMGAAMACFIVNDALANCISQRVQVAPLGEHAQHAGAHRYVERVASTCLPPDPVYNAVTTIPGRGNSG